MRKMLIILAAAVVGCGNYKAPPPPQTVALTGKILLANGNPVPGGQVIFHPKKQGTQQGISEIERDGSFALSSYNKGDGVAEGEYVVVIETVSYKTGAAVNVNAPVPPKYRSATSSDLVVKVAKNEPPMTIRLR